MSSNTDVKLLRQFFLGNAGSLSLDALAEATGLDEKSVMGRIEELRAIGYGIEHLPHSGYSLRHAPDILIADEIQARLPDHPFSSAVLVFSETRSTNDMAHRYGREGHPGPLVIVAESQSHGRGRQGRSWNSKPRLGLWFSVLIRPGIPVQQTQRLTIQTCLALYRSVQKCCHLHAGIKWPNDLVYKGKKLAGILTEAELEGSRLNYAIIGVGCNVNHAVEDFPPELQSIATSLSLESGQKIRRVDLLIAFLQQFERILRDDWEKVRDEWKANCLKMGQSITLQLPDRSVQGQMIDINDDGALVFRHASGTLETLHTGEILS